MSYDYNDYDIFPGPTPKCGNCHTETERGIECGQCHAVICGDDECLAVCDGCTEQFCVSHMKPAPDYPKHRLCGACYAALCADLADSEVLEVAA